MAFIPMNSGSSGGGLTETTLWTNPSPTSAMAGGTTFTLSDDYTNYDYLKFTYRFSTTDATEGEVIVPKSSVDSSVSSVQNSNRIGLSVVTTSAASRLISRSNSTTTTELATTNSRAWGGTGQSTTTIIPTKISGLK